MAREKAIIPEVFEPDEKLPPDLVVLRRFAYVMDEAMPIPGTKMRVGVDAGLSLIPGFGEVAGALLSAWIIVGALRHRVPMSRITRMVAYVLLDMILGAIPVVGTVFDWLFEQNVMNMNALLRYRDRSQPPRSIAQIGAAAFVVIAIILLAALAVMGGLIAGVLWLINQR